MRPGKVGIYLCGPTVYKSPHIGHMVGPVIFDAIKRYLQLQGLRGHVGRQHHRRRRQADRRRRRSRTRPCRSWPSSTRRSTSTCLARARRRHDRPVPQGDGAHRRDRRDVPDADRPAATPTRPTGNVWFDVTKDPDYGKLSQPQGRGAGSGPAASKPPASATPPTSRCGRPPSRASRSGIALGHGPAGVAHRVLGHEHEVPRRDVRHPRRRDGPDVPAPRERAGPVRKRHRPDRSRNTGCTTA